MDDVSKPLLEELRLNFGTNYYAVAEVEIEKLTRVEVEAWLAHPATKALRAKLLGDISIATMEFTEGVTIDPEDMYKTAIECARTVTNMQVKHDVLALMLSLKDEVESNDDET